MDFLRGPTFGGRVPLRHCSRHVVKAIFFPLFCGRQNVGLAHLAVIDKIVGPGHGKAHRRVKGTLETNRDGSHIHRGDVPEAVGDTLSVHI